MSRGRGVRTTEEGVMCAVLGGKLSIWVFRGIFHFFSVGALLCGIKHYLG